jgi:molybdenum cofactor guanylyltransferase
LALIGGVRIIDRVAGALRTVTSELIVVSNDPDSSSWLGDARVVRDGRAERGSLIGLHTVLSNLPAPVEGAIIVAWDMPFVTSELLALLLSSAGGSTFASIPEGPHGVEPMCAYYSRHCLPAVEAALDAGDLRLSLLVERLVNVRRIPVADISQIGDPERLFFNVNTPRDLALAESVAAGPRPA